ncbi:hypothetical protein LCGC14_2411000 [marine sediment metagenome]|uniref:Uncharacterized protein n=1 Tax=marine sediment metagenome TaxID=412755 RepID=A0A0F9BSK9_9ZZZZ
MNHLFIAKEMGKKCDEVSSLAASTQALIAIAEELQKLNSTLEYINGKLTVPPKEAK